MMPSAIPHGGAPGVLDRRRWSDEVYAGLCELLGGPPGVACFDWDNTCIRGDVEESALRWLDARDGGGREATYDRLCRDEGHEVGYTWAATLLTGLDDVQARRVAVQVIDDAVASGAIVWRPEVRDLIAMMQRAGWAVWIVSASAAPLVEAAAQHYGVAPSRVLGVRMQQVSGRFAAALAEPLTWRHGKVMAIERHIQAVPDFVAGDTDTDIEMLTLGRRSLLFDRGNAEALAAARRLGWWVQPVF
jgi:phosphoserine phosphatase